MVVISAGIFESSDLKTNKRTRGPIIEVMTRFGTGLRMDYPVGIFLMRESRCEEDKRYPGGFTQHKYERLILRFSDETSIHTQNQQWTRRRPGPWAASYDNYCKIGLLEELKPTRSEVRGTPSGR